MQFPYQAYDWFARVVIAVCLVGAGVVLATIYVHVCR